jgi:hypothetical protein
MDAVQRTRRETHDAYGRLGGRGRGVQAETLQQDQQALLDLARPARGVLRLDGELYGAAGVGDEFEQPLQGEDGLLLPGRGPLLLPVGRFVAVLPGAEVQGGEVGEFQGGDGAAAVGGAVDAAVVDADEMSVRGQPYIALQGVRPVLDRLLVRGQGVLGGLFGGPAVGDDLDQVLSCVGHRVMVPSRVGRRESGGAVPAMFLSDLSDINEDLGVTGTAYGALTAHGKS